MLLIRFVLSAVGASHFQFTYNIYPLQSDSTKMAGNYDDLDIAGLQLKCNEKTDETLESTRRMMEMCAEAKQASWNFKML